jgi:hypothetical protein
VERFNGALFDQKKRMILRRTPTTRATLASGFLGSSISDVGYRGQARVGSWAGFLALQFQALSEVVRKIGGGFLGPSLRMGLPVFACVSETKLQGVTDSSDH